MSRTHTARATFQVTSWEEKVIADIDGEGTTTNGAYYPTRGLTRADVTYSYAGDLEGSGTVSYLIAYRAGAAPVSGFERFEGTLDGHDGSFVLRHVGDHDGAGVHATLTVVEGMGTGGLEHLAGEATIDLVGHSDDGYDITLTYDL